MSESNEFTVDMLYTREEFSISLLSEMMPLWKKHHDETAAYIDIPLNPDIEMYEKANESKILRIFTARVGCKLVGYQVFFVMRHPHSRDSIQATQDIIFVDKAYRKGLNGYKFLKFCSEALISDGVQVIYQNISAMHDFGHVLERMGYKLCDLVYGRRITPCLPLSQ